VPEVSCPSCGAPVKFVFAQSLLAVCGYCRATLLRRDLDVEQIGRMAALVEDASPIQLGAEGRYRGVHFAVVGRIQVRWDAGGWNEWYCVFDDGRSGWLGDAGGDYTVTFETQVPEPLPAWEALHPGASVALGGAVWEVTDVREARVAAGEPGFVAAFRYAPWLVANLHVAGLPDGAGGAPPAWDNVLYESAGLGYVVATHQLLRAHAGATVLTYYRPWSGGDPASARRALLGASWATLRDDVLRDLGRPHPDLARGVHRLDVMRYGHAMVRPEPGFVWGPARAAAAGALAGPVHLAHADLSGFSLFEEAFDWGSRAAARVLARLPRRT
jgi:hypothetical protein